MHILRVCILKELELYLIRPLPQGGTFLIFSCLVISSFRFQNSDYALRWVTECDWSEGYRYRPHMHTSRRGRLTFACKSPCHCTGLKFKQYWSEKSRLQEVFDMVKGTQNLGFFLVVGIRTTYMFLDSISPKVYYLNELYMNRCPCVSYYYNRKILNFDP